MSHVSSGREWRRPQEKYECRKSRRNERGIDVSERVRRRCFSSFCNRTNARGALSGTCTLGRAFFVLVYRDISTDSEREERKG